MISVVSCYFLTPATLAVCRADIVKHKTGAGVQFSLQLYATYNNAPRLIARVGTFATAAAAVADAARYGLALNCPDAGECVKEVELNGPVPQRIERN